MALKKRHKDRYHFGSEERYEPMSWESILLGASLFVLMCVLVSLMQ